MTLHARPQPVANICRRSARSTQVVACPLREGGTGVYNFDDPSVPRH